MLKLALPFGTQILGRSHLTSFRVLQELSLRRAGNPAATHFGQPEQIDVIPWSLALTIAFTALLTFLVHLFFVYRIFRLSHDNFFIGIPLALLACARLVTTVKMITLRSLREFVDLYTVRLSPSSLTPYAFLRLALVLIHLFTPSLVIDNLIVICRQRQWSFTTGLSLSSLLDVLITSLMMYLLKRNHKANSSMNHVLDKLMLYAFENGALTCAATVTSLVCWLTMHTNLIFMGLHFVISKLYANSLLATLNKRKKLKGGHLTHNSVSVERNLAGMFPDTFGMGISRKATTGFIHSEDMSRTHPELRIQVDQTKMSAVDEEPSSLSVQESDDCIKTGVRDL
ncbi:hypothetical protein NLJ89_g10549 [Agrocybe chaxingu]|uniref:DUF6534 domain-containing protein n=1 Tax=Agrocybe chaxingu TaxID=84603 RepID=A0A9W8JU17_9AGAR|nr:hypothetical protein NLJ89_g10549 [Agrocybe chaxingu]